MLIGYVRVSKSDGTQTLAPQRDALLAAGVEPERIYQDLASGRHDARPGPGLLRAIRQAKPGDAVQYKLHAMTARSKRAVQAATGMESALFFRNRQDLTCVLVSYRTFSQRWAFRPDGQPKPYAQALLTMHRISAEGFGLKERAWNDRANALRWRQLWAVMANICLAAHGHAARIDHRSYAERGIALEPQNKIGPNAARRAACGEPSERVDENRAIARRNAERSAGRTVGKQSR